MGVLRVVLLCAGVAAGAACGGSSSSGTTDGPPQPDAGAPGDAPIDSSDAPTAPPRHVGGWRMAGGDAAGSYRATAMLPPEAAQARVFFSAPGRTLSRPIIDELGNLYMTSTAPLTPAEVLSVAPDGSLRWRTPLASGAYLSDLSLAPNGDVQAIVTIGFAPATVVLAAFDAATGARHDGAAIASDITRMRVGPDGRLFVATDTLGGTPAVEMRPTLDAPASWSWAGGAFTLAVAPDASTLVVASLPASTYNIVALDASSGAERWRYPIEGALDQPPEIAIDGDGSVYVATTADRQLGDAVLTKLGPAGDMRWSYHQLYGRMPRIMLGSTTVTIDLGDSAQSFAKADGQPAADLNRRGGALAIDGADHLLLRAFNGVLSAQIDGTELGEWRGAASDVAISPDGNVYVFPGFTARQSTLFRVAPVAPLPPATGSVAVHVFSSYDGKPFAARVIFAGPNDEPIADVMTDAQGHASAQMDAGYVTVIRPNNVTGLALTTVLGVKAGDTIEVGPRYTDGTQLGTLSLQPPPISDSFGGYSPCSGNNSSVLTVYADPLCRQHAGVLARANVDPPLFSYLTDQTLAVGTLQMPAWQPMASTRVTVSDFPSNRTVSSYLSLFSDVGLTYLEFDKDTSTGGGHGAVHNFWRPTIAGDLLYRTDMRRTDATFVDQRAWARVAPAAAITLSNAELEARWIDPVIFRDGGPQASYLWTQDGQDTGVVGWFSTRFASRAGYVRWDILGPFAHQTPLGGAFTLPQLPDPKLRFGLDAFEDYAQLGVLAANPEVTYDMLRPTLGRMFDFELAWTGDTFSPVLFEEAFAIPQLRRLRFTRGRPVVR